jgi:poly-beta-1,6-N-acetyl-D-glucosamine synthase
MSKRNYAIVSPVRDEEKYLPITIASVVSQSLRPSRWIIVDDGSKDDTWKIAKEAASANSWITAVNRMDRGFRRAGSGVMEAFYEGYRLVENEPWEFLVKLDGDLSFEADYFERCIAEFEADPKLGVAGGLVCVSLDGRVLSEYKDPPFHVRGPCKIYRRECWRQIDGLIRAPGWDTFDLLKANMLHWRTRTFSDIELIHHRPTGAAYGSWSNWTKNGMANYVVGYHPLFMLLKCVRRAFRKPFGVAGAALMIGFLKGYLKGAPQVEDRDVIRYLRSEQMKYLLGKTNIWRGDSTFPTDAGKSS